MLISIVTPSLNQPDWLRLCVASVRDQVAHESGQPDTGSHPSPAPPLAVEHIIQDGGTPGIRELAHEAGAGLHRDGGPDTPAPCSLKIFSEPDAGMYDAVNKGLEKAGGEILGYLNCDEQYLPGALQTVASHFATHPRSDMVAGDFLVVDEDGRYLCSRHVVRPRIAHTAVCHLNTFTCGVFFRRRVWDALHLRFDPAWKAVGDAAWMLDVLRKGVRPEVLGQFVAVHTDRGDNMVMQPDAVAEAARLAATMPVARLFSPVLVLEHRLRKLLRGAYLGKPFDYSIFTRSNPNVRTEFRVRHPTTRWRSRFGWNR